MHPDGSGSETYPLPVTQSVGPGHIPLFIEHLLLGGTELGAALQHKQALASLSLGGLSYKIPPTPAHHPSRVTAREGGDGVVVHTPGSYGYLASGNKLSPPPYDHKGDSQSSVVMRRVGGRPAQLPGAPARGIGTDPQDLLVLLVSRRLLFQAPFPQACP